MTSQLARSPLDPDLYLDGMPLDFFDQMRRDNPCARVELGDPRQIEYAWVVTRYDDVVAVLRDEVRFSVTSGVTVNKFSMSSTKTGGKPSLLTMAREDHRRVRPILASTFTPRAVRTFSEQYGAMVAQVVAAAVAKGEFDAVTDISLKLPMQAICLLLGIPEEDQEMVRRWGDAQAAPLDPQAAQSPQEVLDSIKALWDYAATMLELRREHPQDDVVSRLAPLIDTPRLSHDEYLGIVSLLAFAGNETTRNTISHSIQAMLDHPDVWEALAVADDALWKTAVEELIRWASPVVQFRRTATEDVQLHGQLIRAGDPVVFMLNAANFDPAAFEDPNTLDIRRDPNPHVAFGTGVHFCLGAHLARIEARAVLAELRRTVRRLRPAGPVEYMRATHTRGVRSLPVSVEI